jgi:hypothetical protein
MAAMGIVKRDYSTVSIRLPDPDGTDSRESFKIRE